MKAIDYLADFLSEQSKEDQTYITKELLNELDDFTHRDVILEEMERFGSHDLQCAVDKIMELVSDDVVIQSSDDIDHLIDMQRDDEWMKARGYND